MKMSADGIEEMKDMFAVSIPLIINILAPISDRQSRERLLSPLTAGLLATIMLLLRLSRIISI